MSKNASCDSVQQWGKPPVLALKDGQKRLRIGLSANKSRSIEGKGRIENSFLLRENRVDHEESREAIKAKRQQFRALFEAGLS